MILLKKNRQFQLCKLYKLYYLGKERNINNIFLSIIQFFCVAILIIYVTYEINTFLALFRENISILAHITFSAAHTSILFFLTIRKNTNLRINLKKVIKNNRAL